MVVFEAVPKSEVQKFMKQLRTGAKQDAYRNKFNRLQFMSALHPKHKNLWFRAEVTGATCA